MITPTAKTGENHTTSSHPSISDHAEIMDRVPLVSKAESGNESDKNPLLKWNDRSGEGFYLTCYHNGLWAEILVHVYWCWVSVRPTPYCGGDYLLSRYFGTKDQAISAAESVLMESSHDDSR